MTQIEDILRRAPIPPPPPELKQQLIAGMDPGTGEASGRANMVGFGRSWLARWWPVLAPASASLACAVVLTMRHTETEELKKSINVLSESMPAVEMTASSLKPGLGSKDPRGDATRTEQEEIEQLRQSAQRLDAEVSRLEQLGAENEKLRTQIASIPAALTAEETQALEQAQEKAGSIVCVNNLKQLGLAVRVWGIDNGDVAPTNLLSMTNEMSTPKILYCPADTSRQAATNWASYSSANCSYEYLGAGAPFTEPMRVLFRCPIHGNVCLADGSVQMGMAKTHPEKFVQRDGHLYMTQ